MTPEDRRTISSIGAHARWADADQYAEMAKVREGIMPSYVRRILDKNPSLPLEEARRRAEHLRKADLQRAALKSAQIRRARKNGTAA